MENSPEYTNWNLPTPTSPEQAANPELSSSETKSELSPTKEVGEGIQTTPNMNVSPSRTTLNSLGLGVNSGLGSPSTVKTAIGQVKQIIQQTQDDPHLRLKKIAEFRARFLKEHYNKVLKVEE